MHSLGGSLEEVLGLLAGLTGFFTSKARDRAPVGLPTLRTFQREQAHAGARLLRELWPG